MSTTHHIVLGCTNRKRAAGATWPRLRDVPRGTVEVRAARWIDRVVAVEPARPARDLYVGEYWQAGLELLAAASGRTPAHGWVLSAGLGLVHVDDAVPAYGATFAGGHPDSVVTAGDGSAAATRQAWWKQLAAWPGPSGAGRPRRLAELAETPGARLLVCAGPDYLEAVADDLAAAHAVLGEGRLVVFGSAPAPTPPTLATAWVHVPGRLRLRFGGTLASTGVRTARALVDQLPPGDMIEAARARQVVAAWTESTEPLPRFERKRLSDEEVADWIVRDAEEHPNAAGKSAALRRLRGEGAACEQSRFGRLYDRRLGAAT